MTSHRRQRRNAAFSMIELIVAALILGVASVGALGYQYYARQMSLRANADITAARTARLILDNWKKTGGDETFDLVDLKMGFVKSPDSQNYRITVDNLPITISLDWQDIDQDAEAMVTLRKIEATLRWRSDRTGGALRTADPTYVISTYVRKEEAGG